MRLAPGAVTVALIPAAVAAVAVAVGLWPLAAIGAILATAVVAFYRDPHREPAGDGILAPADGTVHAISVDEEGLELAIFLNIHNVHVTRAPAPGTVDTTERVDGHRRPAFLANAAENAGVHIEADTWTATLRAGIVARRVTPYVGAGDSLERGDRIGHIAFGSRVDLSVPGVTDPADVTVEVGDRVRAGHTVIAAETSQ